MEKEVLVDTHCHLDMPEFDDDRDEVIKRALDAGVESIICIGTDEESSRAAIELSRKYKEIVYATVGIHPHDARLYSDEHSERLKALARQEGVVGIGEIGLDYHYDNSPRDAQRNAFVRQLEVAVELQLPVVIHSREARKDTMRILRESGATRGVMHCFSGDRHMAEEAMALGFYISIAGPVTFKNARRLAEIATSVPDEYLLVETDAPYLTPVPHRGKRNEPAYLVHTVERIAELRGVRPSDIARITTVNARRLFRIGRLSHSGTIAYRIRDSLYLNITNRCSNSCTFCIRFHSDYVKGHNLRLEHEPALEELKAAIGDPKNYREIVFCGYGEPLIRLDLVRELSSWIKSKGGRVRINTNGHGNLIHQRNILPELKGLVDAFSISLDAQDEETYNRLCKPLYRNAFRAVLDFIRKAKSITDDVTVTVVAVPDVDIERCRELAEELGVRFRVREYNVVG